MKKLLLVLTAALFVFSSLLIIDANAATTLYQDNFESYSNGAYPAGWQNLYSGSFGGVSSDVAYTGSKSYKVVCGDNWGRTDYVIKPFSLAGIQSLSIEFSFYLLDNGQVNHNHNFGLRSEEPIQLGCGIQWNKIVAATGPHGTPGTEIGPANWNTWYRIKMVIDVVNKKLDFYVNGKLMRSGLTISADLSQVNNIGLQCPGYNNATIYFDDIVVKKHCLGDIYHTIPSPAVGDPVGVAFDGQNLKINIENIGVIYTVNPADGAVVSQCNFSPVEAKYPLTYDNEANKLFASGYPSNRIFVVDPAMCTASRTFDIGGSYNSMWWPHDITYDGQNLWVVRCDQYGSTYMIYKVDPSDGSILGSFTTPIVGPCSDGLASDGINLWYSHTDGSFYKIDVQQGLADGNCDNAIMASFQLPASGKMTWYDGNLWVGEHYGDFYLVDAHSDPCIPTVIELSSLVSVPLNKKVMIQWSTASEFDNAGFNIYRADSENGAYTKINTALIPAKGSSTQGAAYEFADSNVKNRKTYYYKLEDIDLNGTSTIHGPVSAMPRLLFGFRD